MSRIPRAACTLMLGAALLGCGGEDVVITPPSGCGPLEVPIGAACEPVGVPADRCADGFDADGLGGCAPVLPPEPCPPGQVAWLGETACHPLASCDDPWGGAPMDASTQFVDASYRGASDGSAEKPWRLIQDALAAAAPGAVVAVAAGSYAAVVIDRPVQLWGRCPELVSLAHIASYAVTVTVEPSGGGSLVRGIAIRGPGVGARIDGGSGTIFEQVWIDSVGSSGFALYDEIGPVAATLRDSLVERAHIAGVLSAGGAVEVDRVIVRDILPTVEGQSGGTIPPDILGAGILAVPTPGSANRPSVVVRRSQIERVNAAGIGVQMGSVTVEGSLIRHVAPQLSDQLDGIGVTATSDTEPGEIVVRGSVIEDAHESGVLSVGHVVVVEDTVVRGIHAEAGTGVAGMGLTLNAGEAGPSLATVSRCLFESNNLAGIAVADSSATITNVLVRDSRSIDGFFGDGVLLFRNALETHASIERSRIETSLRAGVASFGADIAVSDTVLACNDLDIALEPWLRTVATVEDGGGNACNCDGQAHDCRAATATLVAPPVGD